MKIVVLELGFADDADAEDFADAIQKRNYEGLERMLGDPIRFAFEPIECRVENP